MLPDLTMSEMDGFQVLECRVQEEGPIAKLSWSPGDIQGASGRIALCNWRALAFVQKPLNPICSKPHLDKLGLLHSSSAGVATKAPATGSQNQLQRCP
jgi:hypothetical protein